MTTNTTKLFYFCGIFDTHPPRLTLPQFPHRPRDTPSRDQGHAPPVKISYFIDIPY